MSITCVLLDGSLSYISESTCTCNDTNSNYLGKVDSTLSVCVDRDRCIQNQMPIDLLDKLNIYCVCGSSVLRMNKYCYG